MSLKSSLLRQFGKSISKKIEKQAKTALADQKKTFKYLVSKAANTQFGLDHNFKKIQTTNDYIENVPMRDYEGHRPYIDQILKGKKHVLWPGMPQYFAKTSGTTSGVKYIPMSKESTPFHVQCARNATFNLLAQVDDFSVFDGKLIFLSGSPVLQRHACGVDLGRLSGIVNHEVPNWLKGSQLPSYDTNCIEEWEAKLDKIVEETIHQDMRLISGIPPWVQMYYERLLAKSGKSTIQELFPNFKLFVYGGVNFEPYKSTLTGLVGNDVLSLETYPASEGFIAFQDRPESSHLLLNTNVGIYYEFVPLDLVFEEQAPRLTLAEVELNKDYAILLTTNAGLWSYNIGDTVRFVSLDPYRVIVSGRIKHFISAFGEHVIGKEVDEAIAKTCVKHNASVVEYTVAPQVTPPNRQLPYHEWFVEWEKPPADRVAFCQDLDIAMQMQNIYYKDLISGSVLRPLVITDVSKGGFRQYMESQGKLGGQNKVPRLSNDRKLVELLSRV